jgi:ribulose-5-phosphate 4-epimerase/fuculose-1-phosphate aldolase
MCQEGSAMVRNPLPVYPHIKTIVTDEEGMEVVKAMGQSKAILLQGHGATTVGDSLNEAVINMFGLEEQAKMNYLAYAAAGPNHPSVPVEWLDEWRNQTHASQLAHFRPEPGAKPPRVEGVWMYYLDKVTRDLERERR